MIYVCKICSYKYDENKEGVSWKDLPDTWVCPVCGAKKSLFEPLEEEHLESPSPQKLSRSVSDAVVETLVQCGVKWCFGMVGHSNLGFAEALRKAVGRGELGYVGIRHEGAAAFACSAYGKLTGRPAACLTIAGPGATNLLTGLADAMCDSSPVIAVTGQIPTSSSGMYAFQELDIRQIFSPVACYGTTVAAGSDFENIAAAAYRNAVLRKGVSHLEIPDDVQVLAAPSSKALEAPRIAAEPFVPSPSELAEAAAFLASASKPLILLGNGAWGAFGAAMKIAELLDCPVATTYRANGMAAFSDPLCCGLVGRSGTPVSAKFVGECDCILAVGVGFSRHTGIPLGKKVVQIDSNRFALGKFYPSDISLNGDARATLDRLLEALSDIPKPIYSWGNVRALIAEEKKLWREEKVRRAANNAKGSISPAAIGRSLSKSIPHDALISLDVGNVAYWFGRYFEPSGKQRMLLSWYLGSIGVGLPAAMGAWCATRENGSEYFGRKVVAVVGDGGIGQYLADWTTVVKNNMDITCVVINNSQLAKISQEERNVHMPVWETELKNPSFAEYSRECGAKGYFIDDVSYMDSVLEAAFAEDGPVIVEILANPDLQ